MLVLGRALSFVVYGEAVPQAALRTGRTGKSYYPNGPELRAWRAAIAVAARVAVAKESWKKLAKHAPCELDVTYWLPRPKTVSERTRPRPTVTPDRQHLDRAVEDALTQAQVVWHDDAQNVGGRSEKHYAPAGAKPCAVITIRPLVAT